jgi:hypothetical protein
MITISSRFVTAFLFPLLLLSATIAHTQNPGGVNTNLQFWIKGDYSASKMVFQAGKVREWIDEKSTFKITNGTAAQRPIWSDGSATGSSVDSLNYNPHVTFSASGTNFLSNTATTPDLLGTSGSIFVVSNMDAGSKSAVTYYSNNLFRYQVKPNFRVQTSDGINVVAPINTMLGYTSDFSSLYNSPRSNARIVTSKGFATTLASKRNGTPYAITNNNTAPFCPGIAAGTFVGANPTNSEYFDGRIAEVIFYNTTLADDNIRKVESYLAIKYGVTLNPNGLDITNGYVNSSGTSLYSRGVDGTTYWNRIIGLGRDDNSALLQKQSHQYDDSLRLYSGSLAATNAANTTSTIANNTFIMMGSNNGKLCEDAATAFEKPTSPSTVRLDREWKMINTGYTTPYIIHIKMAACIGSYWNGGVITLLADDDGNFTNATEIATGTSGVTITPNIPSNSITVTIDPVASGGMFPTNGTPKYITLQARDPLLPSHVLHFEASKQNNVVQLKWDTDNEIGIDHFEIEKSITGYDWSPIAHVKSKGVAISGSHYEATDNSPFANNSILYFRIKEVYSNNTSLYSAIRILHLKNSISIIPSIVTNKANISFSITSVRPTIKVFNTGGSEVKPPISMYENGASLHAELLPPGIYMVIVNTGGSISYGKFMKQ